MEDRKKISPRSTHQIGDMYIHKKHGFIIRIIGRGQYNNRWVEVVKGEVPISVQERVQKYEPVFDYDGQYIPASMEYSTCALTNCFNRLKAGRILFGETDT